MGNVNVSKNVRNKILTTTIYASKGSLTVEKLKNGKIKFWNQFLILKFCKTAGKRVSGMGISPTSAMSRHG